ncbi:MAG: hypothetical protein M1837_003178 [Sclerophora amabilis]|nr:MAG: hypothetical protein M1837_003178 [Sclerophora amabilis]
MDGLLLDSEDLYTLCTNEVLHEYGRPGLPWSVKAQLQGRPGPEAGRIFHEWAQLPISMEEFSAKLSVLQKKHFPNTQPLAGVKELLTNLSCKSSPFVHIALATSSHTVNFHIKTDHLRELFSVFSENQRVLGDDPRIPAGQGKPAPDIYLLALETINSSIRREGGLEILPEECLVFEDSVPGVEAGRRAGMRVAWVPHPELLKEYKGREKEVLAGLTSSHEKDEGQKAASQAKDDITGKEERIGQPVRGAPGAIDDGWAELLDSLEKFPYGHFGIHIGRP